MKVHEKNKTPKPLSHKGFLYVVKFFYKGRDIYASEFLPNFRMKRIDEMVAISKTEKEAISKRFPRAHIVRTMKQKSKRHHYYCEETRQIINFLKGIRNST